MHYDVLVVGGGLAGLTAALRLSGEGHAVVVLEMTRYPVHKVCGEYVSMEVVPYLQSLDINLDDAVRIERLELSQVDGSKFDISLPLGGIGISRFALDKRMYERAAELGVEFVFEKVLDLQFDGISFTATTDGNRNVQANVAIGAYGKRSGLDKIMNRSFINKKSPWLAVKAHYRYDDFSNDLVALHSFNGGYAGLSKTETGDVNFCYLASYKSFGRYRNIDEFNKNAVSQNPFLASFLDKAELTFKKPMTIAQVSFTRKQLVENHVLMCGDAAGLIHPLCGNGMAMAIHSGKMVAEHVSIFLKDSSANRVKLENTFQRSWHQAFGRRLWWGRQLQSLLLNPTAASLLIRAATRWGGITRTVIRQTHGEVIES